MPRQTPNTDIFAPLLRKLREPRQMKTAGTRDRPGRLKSSLCGLTAVTLLAEKLQKKHEKIDEV